MGVGQDRHTYPYHHLYPIPPFRVHITHQHPITYFVSYLKNLFLAVLRHFVCQNDKLYHPIYKNPTKRLKHPLIPILQT